MEQITINGTLYTIERQPGKWEVTLIDPVTLLNCKAELEKMLIMPRNKHAETTFRFTYYSNGVEVKREDISHVTTEADFDSLESSIAGIILKGAAINGLFRYTFKNTWRVFDPATYALIEDQPVEPDEQ